MLNSKDTATFKIVMFILAHNLFTPTDLTGDAVYIFRPTYENGRFMKYRAYCEITRHRNFITGYPCLYKPCGKIVYHK